VSELPVFIRSRGSDLFGILTRPDARVDDLVVLLLPGAAEAASFGRNQVRVRLARRLAALGCHAMRIDYPGLGESTGTAPAARLDEHLLLPLVEDVAAVASWLRDQGLSRVVLMGSCLGSRVALTCVGRLPGLAGLVLVTAPAYDYVYGRMPASGGPEGRFSDLMEAAAGRRLPVLVVYGRTDRFGADFELARRGRLGEVLRGAGDLVSTRIVEHAVYDFPNVRGQEEVVETITGWLAEELLPRLTTTC
jgi:pimeloyl-ACP methyl ester carboxylesterase